MPRAKIALAKTFEQSPATGDHQFMRVVIDTNVIVSGLLFAGVPGKLLDAVRTNEVDLCLSEALLNELHIVLNRAKFIQRLYQAGLTVQGIVASLRHLSVIVNPVEIPCVVLADPADDHVLAAAVAACADLVVSGDSHLLSLGSHRGIAIITAKQALERIVEVKRFNK